MGAVLGVAPASAPHHDALHVAGTWASSQATVKDEVEEDDDEEEEEQAETHMGQRRCTALAAGPAQVMASGPRAALAATPTPAPNPDSPFGGLGGSGVTLKKEVVETLKQLQNRLGLGAPEPARVPAPGPRATRVHTEFEVSTSGEETDGEGGRGGGVESTGGEGDGEGEGQEEEVEEKEEEEEEGEEPRNQRAHESSPSIEGGNQAVHPRSLTSGARSELGSKRVQQLRAPGRVVNNAAVQDNDVQQPEKEEEEEEEEDEEEEEEEEEEEAEEEEKEAAAEEEEAEGDEGDEEAVFAPVLIKPGAGGSCRFEGVYWITSSNKWRSQYQRKYLGVYPTEEAAARAYNKYLKDGIDPVKRRAANRTSQFTGVFWAKSAAKWRADFKGKYLGHHTMVGRRGAG